jgi:hypothetical protein
VNGTERVVHELGSEHDASAQKIQRKRLIDNLNYANFQGSSITVNLRHARYGSPMSVRVYPEPCSGEMLRCVWAHPCPANIGEAYTFQNLMIDRGCDLLIVEAQPTEVTDAGITLLLPEECHRLRTRKTKRQASGNIRVTLIQDAVHFSGVLLDFSTAAFRVSVSTGQPQRFEWLDEKAPIYVALADGDTILYTGQCGIIRQAESKAERRFVLQPLYNGSIKPTHEIAQSEGYLLVPRPSVAFDHPLVRKQTRLEVDEISHSWLSVVERYDAAVLFPGLVLPQVELEVAPGLSLRFRAQVSSGQLQEDATAKTVKWSVVILDMSIEDQGRLFSLLQRARHQPSYAYGKVDLDDLLTFFFDTGFVYPKKYAALRSDREQFRQTYRRLYLESPAITRHFIQMDKGVIQGHLSMIRFYENTWMLHHHAAIGQHAAGLGVLNQARDYVNDYQHLYSSHMDFLVCYYRPNNRFPNRVFGGFTRALANSQLCSTDSMAYFNFDFNNGDFGVGDTAWRLERAQAADLAELRGYYDHTSSGLAIKALDLEPEQNPTSTLGEEYERLGFKRERHLFSLKKDGALKAVFMALVSDAGLNMSGLLNCVHVFVIDTDGLPLDELCRHLALLSPLYTENEIPVLLYPLSYAESHAVSYEKVYNLWAFDTRHTGRFYAYMDSMLGARNGTGGQRKGLQAGGERGE